MTKAQTTALRGLAILLIILHNYTHWMPGCVPENEYDWNFARMEQFWGYIQNGGPHVVLNFFSHFGHYGVALFLFLSGYGLVKKYENPSAEKVGIFPFLWQHAVKLWAIMLPAVVIFFISVKCLGGRNYAWDYVVELLTFTANFDARLPLLQGPWWWFSLMMQFYILYRLIIYNRHDAFLWLLTAGFVVWTLLTKGRDAYWLHHNAPCSILPFALGIWCARHDGEKILMSPILAILSGVVVIAGSFNVWIWHFAAPFAVIVMLQTVKYATSVTLEKVGVISAWIFALHPIVRYHTIEISRQGNDYGGLAIYLIITILAAIIMTVAQKKLFSHD